MSMALAIISSVGIFMAFLSLSLQHMHLLSVLLALEAITMNIFILMFSMFSLSIVSEVTLVLISLGVCEAALGLSILVASIRSWGNDYVSSISSHLC